MKRLSVVLIALALLAVFCAPKLPPILNPVGLVLYAQSLPATVTATWNPNPAAENDVDYLVTVDGGAPVTVLATTCTATQCKAVLSLATYGSHTVTATAQNQKVSDDPALQSGPPASITFTLNPAPTVAPAALGVH